MPTSGSLRNFLEVEMEANEYFGANAGRVWEVLSKGSKTLTQIQKATGLTLREASMGLGWLAREGKVRPINPKSVKGRFELI
jgi:hypothetical protein